MTARAWTAALVYPAPLYLGALVLERVGTGTLAPLLGFALVVTFGSVTGFGLVRHPVWVWLGRATFVLLILVPLANGLQAGPGWLGLAVGVLVGEPFLWLEFVWRESSSPATRIVALQATFFAGVLSLAGLAALPGSGPASSWAYVTALARAETAQLQGMTSVLGGARAGGLPLEAAFDTVYAGLAALMLVAVLLSWMTPRTAHGESLPWSWVRTSRNGTREAARWEELALRPGQREVLTARTRSTPPETILAPGFAALVVAALLLTGFVALAVGAPDVALLTLALGAAAGVGTVAVVLSRRLTPEGGLEG